MRNFKNLNKIQEVQYNYILDQNKAKEDRLKAVYDKLDSYNIVNVWEVNEELQIVKVSSKRKNKEMHYVPFLNYKLINQFAHTFDQALLIALANKYEGNSSTFPTYAERMLNTKFEPEID